MLPKTATPQREWVLATLEQLDCANIATLETKKIKEIVQGRRGDTCIEYCAVVTLFQKSVFLKREQKLGYIFTDPCHPIY